MSTNYSFQLPSGQTPEKILSKQLESNPAYKKVLEIYTARGFQFIKSRAKVFLCYNPDHVESSTMPSLMVIVPSLVNVDFEKDASHTAVSITFIKSEKGDIISVGEVNVSHKPYAISDFKISVYDGETKSLQQLASFSQDQLKEAIKDKKDQDKKATAGSIATGDDVDYIIETTLSQLIKDEYTQSSPEEYKAAILKDSASIAVISRALATSSRIGSVGPLARLEGACTSTSSSSNACTSTSSSITLELEKELANAR